MFYKMKQRRIARTEKKYVKALVRIQTRTFSNFFGRIFSVLISLITTGFTAISTFNDATSDTGKFSQLVFGMTSDNSKEKLLSIGAVALILSVSYIISAEGIKLWQLIKRPINRAGIALGSLILANLTLLLENSVLFIPVSFALIFYGCMAARPNIRNLMNEKQQSEIDNLYRMAEQFNKEGHKSSSEEMKKSIEEGLIKRYRLVRFGSTFSVVVVALILTAIWTILTTLSLITSVTIFVAAGALLLLTSVMEIVEAVKNPQNNEAVSKLTQAVDTMKVKDAERKEKKFIQALSK